MTAVKNVKIAVSMMISTAKIVMLVLNESHSSSLAHAMAPMIVLIVVHPDVIHV